MKHMVTWLPSAQDALLKIILARPDRAAIVGALDRLGATLEREGPLAGELREGDCRVLFELPLAVKFSVEGGGNNVTIAEVWAIREATSPGSGS